MERTGTKWQGAAAAEHYLRRRWRSAWRAGRDPRLVQRLLARHGVPTGGRILDAPCGAGRLHDVLAAHGRYVGLDASAAMLSVARTTETGPVLRGDLSRLPFRERSFELVVACRILHHFGDRALLERVVAELVRVSSRWVTASFWDRGTLPALRRRLGRSRDARADARHARSRAELTAVFAAAGAEVVGFETDTRLLSQQCFCVARR